MVIQAKNVDRPVVLDRDAELQAARALGRSEAERFDGELCRRELADRERIRARDARARGARESRRPASSSDQATRSRLQREEAELTAYRDAILGSRAWRAAERLRGLVGRSWDPPEHRSRFPAPAEAPRDEGGAPPDDVDLVTIEARVEELAAFVTAVMRSRTWRAIQAMRRLVGRAW
jgi:hypothetical protein